MCITKTYINNYMRSANCRDHRLCECNLFLSWGLRSANCRDHRLCELSRAGCTASSCGLLRSELMDSRSTSSSTRSRTRGGRSLLSAASRLPERGRALLHQIRGLRQYQSEGGRRAIVEALHVIIRMVESEFRNPEGADIEEGTAAASSAGGQEPHAHGGFDPEDF